MRYLDLSRGFVRLGSLVLASVCLVSTARADLKLGAPFSDDMVLQRGKPILIWGRTEPLADVAATLGEERTKVLADIEGRWEATFSARQASAEPTTLTVESGDDRVDVKGVLFGDVWLCSGQSNMAMTLGEADESELETREAVWRANVRLLTVPRTFAPEPRESFDAAWNRCSPETARAFSAVGWFFGAALLEEPSLKGVPLGLVDCSFGGTAAEAWISEASLSAFDRDQLLASMFGIAPSAIHNGMIAPLTPFPIAGVVWYQGESNAGRPELYERMLSTLIADWRKRWNDAELPFLVVQLPAFGDSRWPFVREAQAKCVAATPRTALAVAFDTTDGFDLHPKEKREIGRRLALAARRMVYDGDVFAHGAELRSVATEGDSLRVRFRATGAQLAIAPCTGDEVRGFSIAGDDGRYRFAEAKIEGDEVIVQADGVASPKTVRYAWGARPDANLTDGSDLPVAPFRTDDLAVSPVELAKTMPRQRVQTPAYAIEIDGDGRVTSLGVGGQQYLSNSLGAEGGTSIPGFFGPRSLLQSRVDGPDLLTHWDNDATFSIEFRESSMTWSIENRAANPIQFRISLANGVAVDDAADDGTHLLRRKSSVLQVAGIDVVEDGADGKRLRIDVPARDRREIELTIPTPASSETQ